jgi:hypothetical protein
MPFKIDIRNSKKNQKIKELRVASCYVTQLQGKKTNFDYFFLKKSVLKTELSCMKIPNF